MSTPAAAPAADQPRSADPTADAVLAGHDLAGKRAIVIRASLDPDATRELGNVARPLLEETKS